MPKPGSAQSKKGWFRRRYKVHHQSSSRARSMGLKSPPVINTKLSQLISNAKIMLCSSGKMIKDFTIKIWTKIKPKSNSINVAILESEIAGLRDQVASLEKAIDDMKGIECARDRLLSL